MLWAFLCYIRRGGTWGHTHTERENRREEVREGGGGGGRGGGGGASTEQTNQYCSGWGCCGSPSPAAPPSQPEALESEWHKLVEETVGEGSVWMFVHSKRGRGQGMERKKKEKKKKWGVKSPLEGSGEFVPAVWWDTAHTTWSRQTTRLQEEDTSGSEGSRLIVLNGTCSFMQPRTEGCWCLQQLISCLKHNACVCLYPPSLPFSLWCMSAGVTYSCRRKPSFVFPVVCLRLCVSQPSCYSSLFFSFLFFFCLFFERQIIQQLCGTRSEEFKVEKQPLFFSLFLFFFFKSGSTHSRSQTVR